MFDEHSRFRIALELALLATYPAEVGVLPRLARVSVLEVLIQVGRVLEGLLTKVAREPQQFDVAVARRLLRFDRSWRSRS